MEVTMDNSHIHLDIVGGIAGDMFISALLDAFEPLQFEVLSNIKQVIPESIGIAVLSNGLNSGISGLNFSLKLNSADSKSEKHKPDDDHGPSDNHGHQHSHGHKHHKHSNETTYKYLCELLKTSTLKTDVTEIAVALLTIIGKAEAKIHNKTLDDVHFHELADWDSLMDVVAVAVILNGLSKCTWSCSKLPIGSGLAETQHGLIPVPAPATAEILLGFEFFDDNIKGERITPTGAAILHYLRKTGLMTMLPQGHLVATGYGLGTKVFPGMPNILRALHFSKSIAENSLQDKQPDTVVVIEFDIDDMTGEELALSLDILRAQQGVIDVVVLSVRGKKNRSVECIRVLASCASYQNIIDTCFNQTSTIGLRYRFETRQHLHRDNYQVQGLACKSVTRPNGDVTCKIEHDELSSLETLNQRRRLKYQIEVLSEGSTS
jgi:uncharacterized protein (TIGR00299 family) protein